MKRQVNSKCTSHPEDIPRSKHQFKCECGYIFCNSCSNSWNNGPHHYIECPKCGNREVRVQTANKLILKQSIGTIEN